MATATESFTLAMEKLRFVRPLSQQERILRLLKRRGQFGASNRELNSIGYRFSARILELRRDGHNIESFRDRGGLFRYVLLDD